MKALVVDDNKNDRTLPGGKMAQVLVEGGIL